LPIDTEGRMADKKVKRSETAHGVYRVGDLYYCAKCNSVVKDGEACPNCHTQFDWDKIRVALAK
jgi:rubrerythrin